MFLTEVVPPRIFMISELFWGVLNCLGDCDCLAEQENGRLVFSWLDSSSEGSLELCGDLKYAGNVSLSPAITQKFLLFTELSHYQGCPAARSQVEMDRISKLLTREQGNHGVSARLLCPLILSLAQSSLLAFNIILLQIRDTGIMLKHE